MYLNKIIEKKNNEEKNNEEENNIINKSIPQQIKIYQKFLKNIFLEFFNGKFK